VTNTGNAFEIIHVNVFNPSRSIFKNTANDAAEAQVYLCNNKNSCEAYKNKSCVGIGFFNSCPYIRKSIEKGFTKKARKFYYWLDATETKYKDHLNVLSSDNKKIYEIGDFIYLPTAHIHMVLNENECINKQFIPKNIWNLNLLDKIVKGRPTALFTGDVITTYQKEEVPILLRLVEEKYPELFTELCKINTIASSFNQTTRNYAGRKAKLKTLAPGYVKNKEWHWDGEVLKSPKGKAGVFLPCKAKELIIIPEDDAVVTVESNDMITKNTEFVD